MSTPTATRRRRAPMHPLRIIGVGFAIALLAVGAVFLTRGMGGGGLVALVLLYVATAVVAFGFIAWATLYGIRYYDHEMRDD